MRMTSALIDSLARSPAILTDMLQDIPEGALKLRRKPGKWSIHENACHLAASDQMILERFQRFSHERHPTFKLYLPGTTVEDNLMDADMDVSMRDFSQSRKAMVELLRTFDDAQWSNAATHPEYALYNPYILLRHTLMHDHFHMYRIEELWLTREEYQA